MKLDPNLSKKFESHLRRQYEQEVHSRFHSKSQSQSYREIAIPDDLRNWSFGALPLLDYLELHKLEEARILDFGCGAGFEMATILKKMEEDPPACVHGLDLSESMLEQAAKNLAEIPTPVEVKFFNSLDSLQSEEQDPYHLILANAVLHLNPEKLPLFSRLNSLLEPQGELLCAEFVTEQIMPDWFKQEFLNSNGSFLFGGLESCEDFLDTFFDAGFEEAEVLKKLEFDPRAQIEQMLRSNMSPEQCEQTMKQLKDNRFYIAVIKAKPKLESIPGSFSCHHCKHFNSRTSNYYRTLNSKWNKGLYKQFLAGEIQIEQCDQCQTVQYPYPFQIHVMEAKSMTFCFPENFLPQKHEIEKDLIIPTRRRLPHYEVQLSFIPDNSDKH